MDSRVRRGGTGRGAFALFLLAAACRTSGPTDGTEAQPLLQVVAIRMIRLNTDYPERPPATALNAPVCQVVVNVALILPDPCAAFSGFRSFGLEGDTFRFEIHAIPGGCGAPIASDLDLCLPGLGEDPPPPGLPSGHYVVIVNGFTGGFDIP